jgi:hypothetical protein
MVQGGFTLAEWGEDVTDLVSEIHFFVRKRRIVGGLYIIQIDGPDHRGVGFVDGAASDDAIEYVRGRCHEIVEGLDRNAEMDQEIEWED